MASVQSGVAAPFKNNIIKIARTDKKKQRESKKQQVKSSVKFSNPRIKLSIKEAKELGIVVARTNEVGGTYHRFIRGRKACYETKMKFDPDGYRFYKGQQGHWLMSKPPMPNWAKRRLRKRM